MFPVMDQEGGESVRDFARARSFFTPNYRQAPMVPIRGRGVWLEDDQGRPYLDLVAGIAVSSLGHGHPRLVAAIADQAERMIHCSNLYFNEPAVALVETLVSRSFADRVFLTNSGAESNEAAIKLARRYWSQVRGRPERFGLLSFHHSFHGRTLATVTASGQPKYHRGFEPLLPGIHYAHFGDLKSVEKALDEADDEIGAVLVEPIQCEGGLHLPPTGFIEGLRGLCDSRDVLLILDEVQTGVGRTGRLFSYEHHGITPDVITLAKGLGGGVPVGAMLCTEEVARGFEPGSHASTFGGNALAARAASEVLAVIEDTDLLAHVCQVGTRLGQGLEELVERHPHRCVEARGRGLLWGLELQTDDPELGRRVVARGLERGLLLNAIAGRILRLTPPLVIDQGEVDHALGVLDQILADV